MFGVSLFDLFLGAMGAYALISAIRGKGSLFKGQVAKEGYEEKFPKLIRLVYGGVGIAMILNAAASALMGVLYETRVIEAATESAPAVTETVAKFDLGAFSFLTPTVLGALSFAFMLIALGGLIAGIVIARKMTVRAQPQGGGSGQQGVRPATGHFMPDSAFEFDEEEKSGKN